MNKCYGGSCLFDENELDESRCEIRRLVRTEPTFQIDNGDGVDLDDCQDEEDVDGCPDDYNDPGCECGLEPDDYGPQDCESPPDEWIGQRCSNRPCGHIISKDDEYSENLWQVPSILDNIVQLNLADDVTSGRM